MGGGGGVVGGGGEDDGGGELDNPLNAIKFMTGLCDWHWRLDPPIFKAKV